jgi:DNA-binding GntR family transcriptional regulator
MNALVEAKQKKIDEQCDTIETLRARIAELEAVNEQLREALARICANPVIQDEIENNKQTAYLIRDARAALAGAK